jgi:hypothetical protein
MKTKFASKPALTALTTCLFTGLLGCGGTPGLGCTDLYAYGLTVTVKDAATMQPICDATVTATDGSYSETLQAGGLGCSFVGAGERAGTYTVSAAKSGYVTAAQNGIVVTADTCHVHGVMVALSLTH